MISRILDKLGLSRRAEAVANMAKQRLTTSASAHATPSAMSVRSSMPSIGIPATVRHCGSDPGRTGDLPTPLD